MKRKIIKEDVIAAIIRRTSITIADSYGTKWEKSFSYEFEIEPEAPWHFHITYVVKYSDWQTGNRVIDEEWFTYDRLNEAVEYYNNLYKDQEDDGYNI